MTKTLVTALLILGAAGIAAPAHAADDPDSNFGPGVNAAGNWNFSAASVCFQELAVVPVGAPWTGDQTNHCVNGNVLNHSGQ